MQESNTPPKPNKVDLSQELDKLVYYKRVLENFPSPAVLSDNFDRNICVNRKFVELLGYTLEEVGTTAQWEKLAYPDSGYRNVVQETLPDIDSKEHPMRIQHVRCKDGTTRNIIFQDFSLDEEYFVTILEDISEKIETQINLIEAEERYERIVHNFPMPIVVSRTDQKILYVNREFEKVIGYKLNDIPSDREWMILAYPDQDYRDQIMSDYENKIWNSGEKRERRITCKNGQEKKMILDFILIGTDEYITIFQDVTALRTAEEHVQAQAYENRKIIEDASDMIIKLDMDRIIRNVNPACTESLGYIPSEMVGRDFRDFVDSNYWDRMDRMGNLKLEGKFPRTIYELEMIKKDKSHLYVEMNTRFIFKDEKLIFAIAMIRDITKRKRETEEQIHREKIDSIGILAGGIAHDFNNILTSILGSINLLQLSDFNEEDEDILRDLEKATLRAKDLTNQLLTFSKGGVPVRKIETISDILLDSIKFILRGSKVEYNFEIEENLPAVNVDGNQLSQVINNLTINAMQSMPEGGNLFIRAKKVQIRNRQNHPLIEGDYILIEMEDTGNGIPLDFQKHIFEPYFSTKATGSGLGLATAYSIIFNHDGWLSFTSSKQGTTFYIYLPAAKSPSPLEISPSQSIQISNLKRILFLDDDPAIHTVMQGFCAHLGIEVDSVKNSQEFLENFAASQGSTHPYDIIITDLTLPGDLGGDRIIELIREQDPNIPVVVSSGYSNDPIIANYKEYGFTSYLKKPYTIEQLKTTLANLARSA